MPFLPNSARQPLLTHNFQVVVAAVTMGFTEVTGLSREHTIVTYKHGLSFCEGERIAKYHDNKHTTIVLKKGVIPQDSAFLYAWLEAKFEIPMTVSLRNARGLPVVSWRIARAIPVKLTPPGFNATGSAVAIDTLDVMVAGVTVDVVPFVPAVEA